MLYPILLGVIFAGVLATDTYDIEMTVTGITKGVAVEGFTWLVGQKCTSVAKYYLRDWILLAPCFVPTFLALHFHSMPAAYGLLLAPVAGGLKHLQGALAWKSLGVKL
jgi:hypothetical protein